MYLWTRKEIAEAFDVSASTPHYWIHNWGPDSTHPFPEAVARIQLTHPTALWTLRQLAYDPGAVQQWFAGLAKSKTERMSLSQTGITRSSKRDQPPSKTDNLQIAVEAIAELRSAMAVLVATRSELVALQQEVHELASPVRDW